MTNPVVLLVSVTGRGGGGKNKLCIIPDQLTFSPKIQLQLLLCQVTNGRPVKIIISTSVIPNNEIKSDNS